MVAYLKSSCKEEAVGHNYLNNIVYENINILSLLSFQLYSS